jgi:nicotinamidase-related amidase
MPTPSSRALFVIDVQQSFMHRPYWPDAHDGQGQDEVRHYLQAQNNLIQGCLTQGLPIIRVLHQDGPDRASNPFSLSSGLVKPLDGLMTFEADATVVKNVHSAAVGTDLMPWLRRHQISSVIISGIRTEQCCETTTRHLSDEGWAVDYVLDATLTFPIKTSTGRTLHASDIRHRTAVVLEDRFARICSVEQAIQGRS